MTQADPAFRSRLCMADSGDEIRKLLRLFRKGHISEEMLLEQMAELVEEAPAGTGAGRPVERDGEARRRKLVEQLDAYRAAEASGAETVASWAQISTDKELKGGLRAVAARVPRSWIRTPPTWTGSARSSRSFPIPRKPSLHCGRWRHRWRMTS